MCLTHITLDSAASVTVHLYTPLYVEGGQLPKILPVSLMMGLNSHMAMAMRPLVIRDAQRRRDSRIKQANELIRSRQEFTTMQRRLFYIAMAAIGHNDQNFDSTVLPEPLLRALLDGNYGSFKNDLEEAAHGLAGTTFQIAKKKGGWSVSSVFNRIEYLHPGEVSQEGWENTQPYDLVNVQLHNDLKPYLLGLEGGYNTQILKVVLDLPLARSHKLYELLLHEGYAGKRREVFLSREELKVYLGIEGEYSKFRDLRRVIDRCKTHIESVTEQRFSYEGVREGRSITSLRFEVWYETRAQGELLFVDAQTAIEEVQAASELIAIGYNRNAYEAVQTYGHKLVSAVVKEVQRDIRMGTGTGNPIRNPGGFAARRLEERQQALAMKEVLEAELPEADVEPAQQVNVEKLAATLIEAFESYRAETATALWEAWLPEAQQAFLDSLAKDLNRFEQELVQKPKGRERGFLMIRNREILARRADVPGEAHSLRDFLESEGLFTELEPKVKEAIVERAEIQRGV